MKKVKSIALLLSVLLLFTAVFCGCGSNTPAESESAAPSSESSPAPVEQTLVAGCAADFKSGGEKKTLIFDTLMDSLEDMSAGPRIVTECTPNENYSEYTLKIRDDVSFSDGTRLTADIVKFNLEYWPVYRSCGYADYLDSVTVADDTTLDVKLKSSYGSFKDELQKIWVTKPDEVDDKGNFTDWIGTGPYILQDYKQDMSATLVLNEAYWRTDKMPGIKKVEFKVITDSNARVLAIQSGDVDVIGLSEHFSVVDYANVPELQNDPNLNVQINTGYGTITDYSVNWKTGVCSDINVRKAISYGIDRDTLCSKVLFGVPEVGDRLLCEKYQYSPENGNYTYDALKAKEHLKAAGYTDTDGDGYVDKDGNKLTINLLIKEGQQVRNVAVFVQDCLKQTGIEVALEILDASTFKTRVSAGEFDLCATHPWYAPAAYFLVWRGDSEDYDNYGTGCGVSERVHEITKGVLESGDTATREKLFAELWEIEDEFVSAIPMYYSPRVFVSKKNIEGLHFCASVSEIDLSGVVIK